MAASQATAPPLLRLCNDNLLLIALHLPFKDRFALLKTHRRIWGVLEGHLPESINMCNTPPGVAAGVLSWIQQRVPHIKSLNLHGQRGTGVGKRFEEVVGKCTGIEVLCLQHCSWVRDAVVGDISKYLGNSLRQISLWDTGPVSKDAMLNLVRSCGRLEIMDLRGQNGVDDDVLREMGSQLTKLRKVSLAGTSVTGAGVASLLEHRKDSLQRLGCIGLPAHSTATAPLRSDVLHELQISWSRGPITADIQALPALRVLGVGGLLGGVEAVLDWNLVATPSCPCVHLTQIMTDGYYRYPSSFIRALERIGGQLKYLSLGHVYQDNLQAALRVCRGLKQLVVTSPPAAVLRTMAREMPELRCLRISGVGTEELRRFLGEAAEEGEGMFPSLSDLCVTRHDDDGYDEQLLPQLLRSMPCLEGLSVDGFPGTVGVLESLPMLNMRSLCVYPPAPQGTDAPEAWLPLVAGMKRLNRLILPSAIIFSGGIHNLLDPVLRQLPDLKSVGPQHSDRYLAGLPDLFSSWYEVRAEGEEEEEEKDDDEEDDEEKEKERTVFRYIRLHHPYGFKEEEGIKPFNGFVSFLEEDVDLVNPVLEP